MNFSFPDSARAVVATVTQSDDLDFLSTLAVENLPCDILEFRLDNLRDQIDRVRELQARFAGKAGILSTARRPEEAGAGDLPLGERLALLEASLEFSDFIDIEIHTLAKHSEAHELAQAARRASVSVVASSHDFEKSPPAPELVEQLDQAANLGADIGKLAIVVETFAELNALVTIVEDQLKKGRQISAMGMGPLGKISRLTLSKAGSCLNYGYLKTANAPGQWSAAELRDLLLEI